jgi:hypothetical protein
MSWYNFKKAVVSWAADIRLYPGGIILFGDSHYHLKGPEMRKILEAVQPGDVLLRRYSHYIGSVTIPGYWSHAAIYVGNDYWIIHMLGEGITKEDILTFLRCDDACVLRCKNKDAIQPAIDKAYEQLEKGTQYDYDFDTDNADKLYCTELIEYCFDGPMRGTRGFFEVKSILPDEIYKCSVFEVVWEDERNKEVKEKKIAV